MVLQEGSGSPKNAMRGTENFVNDVAKDGVKDYSDIAIAAAGGSLTRSLLGAAIAVLINLLETWLLVGCDGLVAAETITYCKGRDMQDNIALQ